MAGSIQYLITTQSGTNLHSASILCSDKLQWNRHLLKGRQRHKTFSFCLTTKQLYASRHNSVEVHSTEQFSIFINIKKFFQQNIETSNKNIFVSGGNWANFET